MQPEVKLLRVGPHFYGLVSNFIRSGHASFFCIVNPEAVISMEQLGIAYEKSTRMFKYSRVKNMEALFLMLISGETQISKAIRVAGLNENLHEAIAVYTSENDLENLKAVAREEMQVMEIGKSVFQEKNDDLLFTRMAKVQLSAMPQPRLQ